ncbi:hypothetical protein [Streptomyces sp. NPDC017993]|uniref:hypothetical protein n=1 Tax=Streptomyces sp. NPDC017993 TaxID=3365027 RepID=UPI0037AA7AFE
MSRTVGVASAYVASACITSACVTSACVTSARVAARSARTARTARTARARGGRPHPGDRRVPFAWARAPWPPWFSCRPAA